MAMMQTVTEPGGTSKDAAILGYHVAGKTGTARIASGGGYSRRYAAFFAGVVPVDNPRFSMAVVVMNPDPSRRGYYGGRIAGPVFHNVRSEEHTSELQSLMRISYAVFCLKKKTNHNNTTRKHTTEQ